MELGLLFSQLSKCYWASFPTLNIFLCTERLLLRDNSHPRCSGCVRRSSLATISNVLASSSANQEELWTYRSNTCTNVKHFILKIPEILDIFSLMSVTSHLQHNLRRFPCFSKNDFRVACAHCTRQGYTRKRLTNTESHVRKPQQQRLKCLQSPRPSQRQRSHAFALQWSSVHTQESFQVLELWIGSYPISKNSYEMRNLLVSSFFLLSFFFFYCKSTSSRWKIHKV